MGKINVLPFAVANLIAAGEVVDRPASVIKELMENAIDAGATRMTVEIQNGGVTLMRVTDNGCGMSPEDLPCAIRRHATSKIQSADDLERILTLGFRGEALAAIASVSKLRIISKTADAPIGAMLECNAGELVAVTEQGCSQGTSVIVENLFANVPARRKFLKKDITEAMAVTANVEKLALSHPEIAVRLIVDGNSKLETAGDGVLLNTVHAVFGKEFSSKLIEIDTENDGISLKGYIGRTDNFKANRNHQNFFINGRFVKSKTASAALEQAYTSYMPPEKFPCCVLELGLNPARVDVNVHPAKLEVKFSNEKPIFELIYYAVRTALENNVTRPAMNLQLGGKRQPHVSQERVSDAVRPVEEGRAPSLQSRQLVYDLQGHTQPQPQQRMTAEEYRRFYAEPLAGKGAPPRVPTARPDAVNNSGKIPVVTDVSKEHTTVPVPPSDAPATAAEPSAEHAPQGLRQPIEQAPLAEKMPLTEERHSAEKPQTSAPSAAEADGAGRQQDATPALEQVAGELCAVPTPEEPTPSCAEPASEVPAAPPAFYRIVGEVFHSYLIVETGEKMLLIDKHAAHERILFEQLKANLSSTSVCSQMLMLPVELMLTSAEAEALKEYQQELEAIGFSISYGRNTVSVFAIPEGVESTAVPDMLQTMAGRILTSTGSVRLTRDILFEKALYQAACKAAIKAGREYVDGHVQWLVAKLMELPDITFCPHGRPVALELTHRALDRQFDRTGF